MNLLSIWVWGWVHSWYRVQDKSHTGQSQPCISCGAGFRRWLIEERWYNHVLVVSATTPPSRAPSFHWYAEAVLSLSVGTVPSCEMQTQRHQSTSHSELWISLANLEYVFLSFAKRCFLARWLSNTTLTRVYRVIQQVETLCKMKNKLLIQELFFVQNGIFKNGAKRKWLQFFVFTHSRHTSLYTSFNNEPGKLFMKHVLKTKP